MVEVLAAVPKPELIYPHLEVRQSVHETRCAVCDGPAYALGGGSLWCLRCLRPFIAVGERFRPSIETRKVPA